MLIYCPNCQNLVSPQWTTCRACGARVDNANSVPYAPPLWTGTNTSAPLPSALDSTGLTNRRHGALVSWLDRTMSHQPPSLGVALTAIAVFVLLLSAAIWAATRSADSSAFQLPKDRATAALQIGRGATSARPMATNTAPPVATSAATAEPALPTADVPDEIPPAAQQGVAESDEEPRDRPGRGNGRGRGHENEGSDD